MLRNLVTRRAFAGALAVSPLLRPASAQTLRARPGTFLAKTAPGLHSLNLRKERDTLLYIPESAAKVEKAPLVVSLHGATRDANRGIELLKALSDEHGFLLLAPASRDTTWDAIGGDWGGDVAFVNESMARTFEMWNVDPARVAMAGFSDGASYSLSIGLANGNMFRAVFGFSPGFVVPAPHTGKPPVFISHGTLDPVLPIAACSRRIVPQLKKEGYNVTYREFEGKHTLPPDIAADAMRWFMDMSGSPA